MAHRRGQLWALSLLLTVFSSIAENPVARVKRQNCGALNFQCQNGECIERFKVCDGATDCSDKSDENQVTCKTIRCPEFSFRCSYGGCIDEFKKCDGQQDCADNSDELLLECPNIAKPTNGTCLKRQFHCNSGECIDDASRCDGTKDCKDGSDETLIQCSAISCSDAFFRCAYGACVDENAACDGTVQCEGDGSDEAPELCGTSPAPKCTLPLKHENGGYKVVGCESQSCGLGPGAQVPFGTQLEFFCDEGYHISGLSASYCFDKTFTPPPPVCEKTQCPPLVYDSLDIKCFSSTGQKIPCDKPMSIGSKAQLACKKNYVKTVEFNYPALTCTSNGTWDNQPFTCVPECGKPIPKGQTYVLNGRPVLAGEFPWHVGIYLLENGKFEQKCGGSIIKRKLVLTAAHCFVKSKDPKDYMIGAGKYHRGWDVKDETEQRFEVESIEVKDTYEAATRNYADDIAIIVLKIEITISDFVRPVCVDLESKYDREQLSSGNNGSVAGWGYTESGAPSETLLTTQLPFIEFKQCYKLLPLSFKPYFTPDKFCAGYINGSAVCQGDSGGGLSFEQEVTASTKQWFIQGIVSLGVPSRGGKVCSSQRALFTKVNSFLDWIKIYYDKY
ncbi:modular serine protease-like [Schistocerca cancellata]|uniref:modular serine protease-like n=1 Tax=Schistocerca cancellata TaxID=274614 RepID=UPI0021192F5D|nr:modular serine protease-like [Schistocerca cancellata]